MIILQDDIIIRSSKEDKKRSAAAAAAVAEVAADDSDQPKQRQKREHWEHDLSRLTGPHFCKKIKGSKKAGGSGYVDNRGYCIMCQVKKVSYRCEQCKVFLCIQDNQGGTCFSKFHTKKRLAN